MDWLRWWHGTVTDPKFRAVARKSKSPLTSVLSVWACLLEDASQAEDRGRFSLNGEVVAANLDMEGEEVERIVAALCDMGIVADRRICNWEKRQPGREDDSRERVKEFRRRKRVTQCNADVTQGNAAVTQSNAPDTDTDTDTDTELLEAAARSSLQDEAEMTLREVCHLYQNAFGKVVTPSLLQRTFQDWRKSYPRSLLEFAFEKAARAGASTIDYVEKILKEGRREESNPEDLKARLLSIAGGK